MGNINDKTVLYICRAPGCYHPSTAHAGRKAHEEQMHPEIVAELKGTNGQVLHFESKQMRDIKRDEIRDLIAKMNNTNQVDKIEELMAIGDIEKETPENIEEVAKEIEPIGEDEEKEINVPEYLDTDNEIVSEVDNMTKKEDEVVDEVKKEPEKKPKEKDDEPKENKKGFFDDAFDWMDE